MHLKHSRYDQVYMEVAKLFGNLSHDNNYKVGAVIVKNGQILSQGWNGMPAGMDNTTRTADGTTRPELIHAEANALMKLARNGGSAEHATVYTTFSPCYSCAGLLIQAGVQRVCFENIYDQASLKFLKERGVSIVHIKSGNRLFK